MSRNIPQVRQWRVTVYFDDDLMCRDYHVLAPNKRFAWWNAHDHILVDVGADRFMFRSRVTISPYHKPLPHGALLPAQR